MLPIPIIVQVGTAFIPGGFIRHDAGNTERSRNAGRVNTHGPLNAASSPVAAKGIAKRISQ